MESIGPELSVYIMEVAIIIIEVQIMIILVFLGPNKLSLLLGVLSERLKCTLQLCKHFLHNCNCF